MDAKELKELNKKLSKKNQVAKLRKNGTLSISTYIDQKKEPTKAQQHYKEIATTTNIVKRYLKTGQGFVMKGEASFDDVCNIPDYQTAMNNIAKATEHFEGLPSKIRKRFANDPVEFLDFMQDSNNKEEAIKLGLYKEKVKEPSVMDKLDNIVKNTTPIEPPANE
jgi:phage internal scaffolding protein